MVQIFRNKSISSVIAVILLAIAAHIHFFFSPVQINVGSTNDGLLSVILQKYISTLNNSVIFLIYITVLLLQAILFALSLNNLKMFKTRGYTIAMSYILLSAIIPQWHSLSAGFIANIFVVWLFFSLGKLYNNQSVKSLLFNTGILTTVIFVLYIPFIVLFIFSLIAVAILRPFNIKEWLIFITGCLTPLYLLFSYLFLTDQLHYIQQFISTIIFYPNTHFQIDTIALIKIGYGLFIFVLGFLNLSVNRNQMLIQSRRYWNLMLIYLLLITDVPFLLPHAGIEAFIICIIPFSAFAANIFAAPQRNLWIINFLLLILIGVVAHTNWMLIKI